MTDRVTLIEQLYGIADAHMPISYEARNVIVEAATLLAKDATAPTPPTPERIIADWLKSAGATWGTGPGALIAELDARGYKIVKK